MPDVDKTRWPALRIPQGLGGEERRMQLTLARHPITEIHFGTQTQLDGTTLVVDSEELRHVVLEDETIESVNFEIVRPGENCRAGPIFDIVQPRAKEPGSSPDFPGILGPPTSAGDGDNARSRGSRSFSSGRTIAGRVEKRDGPGLGDERRCCRSDGVLFAATLGGHPEHSSRIADSHYRQSLPYSGHKSRRLPWPRGTQSNSGIDPDLRTRWVRASRDVRGCLASPTSAKFFPASGNPRWTSRFSTAPTRRECCRSYSIPTNGWTEPSCRRCSPGSAAPNLFLPKSSRDPGALPAPSGGGN